jgi:hypothetical protein
LYKLMDDNTELREFLKELKVRHRDLDEKIAILMDEPGHDQIQMQRLKKQKLTLRDEISSIEARLVPDIIA